jgi:hypothetical protein
VASTAQAWLFCCFAVLGFCLFFRVDVLNGFFSPFPAFRPSFFPDLADPAEE